MKHDCLTQYMGMSKKLSPTTAPNLLANQSLPLPHLMPTSFTVLPLVHLSLHAVISANQTPTDWYSKKQATVETATYGSEFVAAKTATEQIMDLRYTLSYLGVPIKSKSYMFGDNRSVVTSATLPPFNPEQETQHSSIPQGQGSDSCQNHLFSLDPILVQSQ